MLKFKKSAAATIAVALLFAACGGNGGTAVVAPEAAPAAETPVAEATEPAENVPDEPAQEFVRDLGGREIRLLSWWQYWIESGDPAPDPATASNFYFEMMFWENMQRVERDFNVTFVAPQMGFDELLPALTASVMAGDPIADMFYLGAPQTFSAIMGNLIHPASDFAPAGADLTGPRNFVLPRSEFDGEIWSFDRNEPEVHGMGLGVNLDIIDAIGMENPANLYERGEWTWDAMREIIIRATRDTTGDGVIDEFGISGQPGDIFLQLIASNDGQLVDTATRTYGFDHPNTLRALEFAFDIFNTYSAWYYDSGDPGNMGDWNRNYFSFREGRSALFPAATWSLVDGLSFRHSFVPFPQGPDNQRGYVRMAGFTQGIVIPLGVPNPQDVYLMFEEIMSWPGDDPLLAHEGVMEYARTAFLTEADVQRMLRIGENFKFDIGMAVHGYYWVLGEFASAFRSGEMTVMQAVETHRHPQQAMLDEVFGN